MPSLMSVAHTTDAVVNRSKTVTRRAGWLNLAPGKPLTLCRKVMGRRKGEPLERLVDVEVVDVRREPLQAITVDDVAREGFPDWTREQFLDFYCDAMGGTGLQEVTRIEWRYLEPAAATVAAAVAGTRFLYGDEAALQLGLAEAFARAGLLADREVSLNPSGRIDFLIHDRQGPRTGVEVKVTGTTDAVVRQLRRYAPHVDDLVLVTTKARHREIPTTIDGRPCRVILIRGAAW